MAHRIVKRKTEMAGWLDVSFVNCLSWDDQMAHLWENP